MRRNATRPPRAGGFTLLELLLAVLVFGLMAAAAYGALAGMGRAAAAQDERGERLRATQLAVLRLERELRQAIAVDLRGLVGDAASLAFVTPSPGDPRRLQRVEYGLDGERLWRRATAGTANIATAAEPGTALDGVDTLAFAYLDGAGEWRDSWRGGDQPLPLAVRLVLDADGLGRIERWVELAGDRP